MTDPSVPQPDDERPVTDEPDPDEPTGEEQPKPDHDLDQDDDLQAGQYS